MSIALSKYINITSGVAGATALDRRELIQRIYTTNILVPVNQVLETTTLDEVGAYFGTESEEYLRAVEYFNFISKSANKNNKISFFGYSLTSAAALIIGDQGAQNLAALQAFTTAELTLTLGGVGGSTGATIDLSASGNIADAMTVIESALQALDASALFTAITVEYDPVGGRVNMTAGANGLNEVVITSATAGFLDVLGWALGVGISDGTDGETIAQVGINSDSVSDNFGSHVFVETLSIDDVEAFAAWNSALNVKYMYLVPTTAANAQLYQTTLANYSGVSLTLITAGATDYAESIPSILLGTTNYDESNSVINYMYQIVNYPVSVDDDATSDALDALDINYNGQTQSAGSEIFFYQRGKMLGTSSAPLDMNVYANEMWFKDAIKVAYMNLFLAVERISANTSGRLTLSGTLQGQINSALNNGTITIGKILTALQRSTIKEISASDEAADQVQNAGYWYEINFIADGNEVTAVYTLIYSKDDVIRKIEGSQILI